MKSYFSLYRRIPTFILAILTHTSLCVATTENHIFINEIQVANIDQYIDNSFNYGSWVEFYNPNKVKFNFDKCILRHTDSDGHCEQYTLSARQGSVAANGYNCLWFDHHYSDGNYGSNSTKQIPYKLDVEGGTIELLDASGSVVCSAKYPKAIARCSWLRTIDGGDRWSYTSSPTPKATNNHTCFADKRLEAPVVDTDGAVFSLEFTFSVAIPDKSTLYYTTDGSAPVPGKSSVSKNGRFTVQSTTIYRFLLARDGYLNSPVVTRSFIQSSSDYYLPIVSVVTDPRNLFNDTIGLYVIGTNGLIMNNLNQKANQNMDWERPVNFEYFVPDNSAHYTSQLNQEVDFKLFGGWSRFHVKDAKWGYKPSFKLKSSKEYEGINELSYPFFPHKPHIKLKSLLVRNGGQKTKGRIWDASIQEIVRSSGLYVDCQTYQPAQIFLNGEYLAMFNLREESNHQFAYSNYGIDSDDIDQWENDGEFNRGDSIRFKTWVGLCKQLADDPDNATIWHKIEQVIDVDEFCNYMATEIYIGNQDWTRVARGIFHNMKSFCSRSDDGRIHYMLFDIDEAFFGTNLLSQILSYSRGNTAMSFQYMLRNERFRQQFIDAMCIVGGSVFEPTRSCEIIDHINGQIQKAILLENISSAKDAISLKSIISDQLGHYAAEMKALKKYFNLSQEYTLSISSQSVGYRILLNGQEIPTGKLEGSLFAPIKLSAHAPAGQQFVAWKVNGKQLSTNSVIDFSTLQAAGNYTVEAVFKPLSDLQVTPVCINEVSAGNDIFINEYGKRCDYIELYNTTDRDIDLEGFYLSDNPDNLHKHQIQSERGKVNTIIPAHGYRIVWCDKRESAGQIHTSFKLDNADGACVCLTAADDSWSDRLEYRAQSRWYSYGRYPDGGDMVALFSRPTIEGANRICTDTQLIPYQSGSAQENGSYTVVIDESEWQTICVPFAFTLPQGLEAYTVVGIAQDGTKLELEPEYHPSANMPYLLHAPKGQYTVSGRIASADTALRNGLLTGVQKKTYAPKDSYVLQNHEGVIGFYRVFKSKEISIPTYHCYLSLPSSSAARFLSFVELDTSIDIIMSSDQQSLPLYNYWGIRTNHNDSRLRLSNNRIFCQ